MNDEEIAGALELTARLGAALLANACSAGEVAGTALRITEVAGLEHVTADVTYTEVVVSHRPVGRVPMVVKETARTRDFNYGRQTQLKLLAHWVVRGTVGIAEARDRLERILEDPGPYPTWMTRLFTGLSGAAAAVLFGGGWLVALVAFLANALLDWVFAALGRRGWPVFFLQVLAGFVGQAAAVATKLIDPSTDASVVVIAVILIMFAGMASTGAVVDAIMGWTLTAVGRFTEALLNTIGLVLGIRAGMVVTDRLGVDLALDANVALAPYPLWFMLLACAFVAVAFSIVARSDRRVFLPAALSAIGAWTCYSLGQSQLGLSTVWAAALAALFAGMAGTFFARFLRASVDSFAVTAILPMLPGLALYKALWAVEESLDEAMPFLVTATATAFVLAACLTLGEYLAGQAVERIVHAKDYLMPVFEKPFSKRTAGAARDAAEVGEETSCTEGRRGGSL